MVEWARLVSVVEGAWGRGLRALSCVGVSSFARAEACRPECGRCMTFHGAYTGSVKSAVRSAAESEHNNLRFSDS